MSYSESQATEILLQGIELVASSSDKLDGQLLSPDKLLTTLENYDIAEWVYVPDDTLKARIADYNLWCQNQTGEEDAGELMEEVALLSFKCLKGFESTKSFQSYAPQHDLVISGSTLPWFLLMLYLHLPGERRTIIVEAKNLAKGKNSTGRVNDQQFSRLCSILQNKFDKTSDLGVFFSRFGATGFPRSENSKQGSHRKRVLRDAQATQIIFHAKTGKYVVVLDHQDIQRLTQPGALPRILEAKIREVEEWTGLPLEFDEEWKETDLPPHLLKYVQQDNE